MDRNDVLKEVLAINSNNILLEFPTGFGKTRMAIEKVKSLKCKTLLLVVHRVVHKETWEEEFHKWWKNCNMQIIMTTYTSLHKYAGIYDVCIFDECHHLSERCRDLLGNFKVKYSILLSATVSIKLKNEFSLCFPNLYIYRISLRKAIDEHVLPDPKVYLIPLSLSTTEEMRFIWKNKSGKGLTQYVKWKDRWDYANDKRHPIIVTCTHQQYIEYLNSQIDFWKKRYMRINTEAAKNKWLRLCSDRLRWLSDLKTPIIQEILKKLEDKRTLTFCNNITQTSKLGKDCINSKNKRSKEILQDFNDGMINHITACNILNEGVNITNCQVGIYANLNSSDTIVKQRAGRLLRHKSPIIIIPYYKDTREEELIRKMLENYNKDLIITINDFHNLKI